MNIDSSLSKPLQLLSYISGMASVVYEVLYMRHLTSHLGDMYYVHAAIVATFLLGLGIGARLAHRFEGKLYAFELFVGAYAICFPAVASAFLSAFSAAPLDPPAYTLISVAILIAPPSIAIGFSLPLFASYIERASGHDEGFPMAYLLYNVGASVSILVFDAIIIRKLGIVSSLRTVGALNLLCGAALWSVRHRTCPAPRREDGSAGLDGATAASFFLASAATAIYQSYFLKTYYDIFGPRRENFAICTAAILFSIAIGSHVVRKIRISYQQCLLLSIGTLAIVAFATPIVGFYNGASWGKYAVPWPGGLWKLAVALFLGGLPYIWLGATIPSLVVRSTNVARDSGRLLLLSGVANAIGTLAYIYFVHPWLGHFAALAIAGILLLFALLVSDEGVTIARGAAAVISSMLALFAAAARPEAIAALGFEALDEETTVTLFKQASDDFAFIKYPRSERIRYNGYPSIEIRYEDRVNYAEIVSGIIPALVAPRLERAMVMGLGSGITGGTASTLFDRTDIAEISGASIMLASSIGFANFEVSKNPRAAISHQDGRLFLAKAEPGTYDAVVNSIPSPAYYAAGKIYTAEFFDLAKRALKADGVYSTWFTPGDMTKRGVDILLATLASRFEHCVMTVLRHGYYFASCSDAPIRVRSFGELRAPAAVIEHLNGGVPPVPLELYFSSIFVSFDLVSKLRSAGIPLNTDDYPILEYEIGRKKGPGEDLLVESLERFNVDTGRMTAIDEDFLGRALVFSKIHEPLFASLFAPIIFRDPDLEREFERIMTAR